MSVYRIFFINLQVINIFGTKKDFFLTKLEKNKHEQYKSFSVFKLITSFFSKGHHKEFDEGKATIGQICV